MSTVQPVRSPVSKPPFCDLARYGDDGTFLDLTPYLTPEIMPNLCAILETHPEIRAAATQEDGKI